MLTLEAKVADFLNQKRIAVAGVSRTKPSPANLIYNKLKHAGYQAGVRALANDLRGQLRPGDDDDSVDFTGDRLEIGIARIGLEGSGIRIYREHLSRASGGTSRFPKARRAFPPTQSDSATNTPSASSMAPVR